MPSLRKRLADRLAPAARSYKDRLLIAFARDKRSSVASNRLPSIRPQLRKRPTSATVRGLQAAEQATQQASRKLPNLARLNGEQEPQAPAVDRRSLRQRHPLDPSVISSFFHQHPSLLDIPPFARIPRHPSHTPSDSRVVSMLGPVAPAKLFSALASLSQSILQKQPRLPSTVSSNHRLPRQQTNPTLAAGKPALPPASASKAESHRRSTGQGEPDTCATSLCGISQEKMAKLAASRRPRSRPKHSPSRPPRLFFAKSVVPRQGRPQDTEETKRHVLAAYLRRDSVKVKLR